MRGKLISNYGKSLHCGSGRRQMIEHVLISSSMIEATSLLTCAQIAWRQLGCSLQHASLNILTITSSLGLRNSHIGQYSEHFILTLPSYNILKQISLVSQHLMIGVVFDNRKWWNALTYIYLNFDSHTIQDRSLLFYSCFYTFDVFFAMTVNKEKFSI